MATLFRQLVTRAGKPPPASAGREAYTFWVGNLLPTKSEHRLPLLQTRITKVRMVLLLRLMTEKIEQQVRTEEEQAVAAAVPAPTAVAVALPAPAPAAEAAAVAAPAADRELPSPPGHM